MILFRKRFNAIDGLSIAAFSAFLTNGDYVIAGVVSLVGAVISVSGESFYKI